MKTTSTLKRALVIGTTIVALGAATAFAATNNSQMNNKNNNSGNQKHMKQGMKQGPKALYRDSKVAPMQTLAKLLGEYPKEIREDAHKDFSDVYQYAQKKGVLNKYKAERVILAKENIQKAVDHKKITKEEGSKILKKVQYNITHEKPEAMGIRPGQRHQGPGRHGNGERGQRMHHQNNNDGPRMNQNAPENCQR